MKNEKYKSILIYLVLILAGFLLGWLLFARGGGQDDLHDDHEMTELGIDVEYTCSMHPQVRQDQPGDCPICGMDLIPVGHDDDDDHGDDPFLMTMTEGQATWANVQTSIVESTNSGSRLTLTGEVAMDERSSRLITATFPGRIEQLFADYTGLTVSRGQRLARIYSPELMQAQQELIMAARQKEQQPRLYQAARSRMELFNLTEQQIKQIEERGEASPSMDVYSTIAGVLTSREVSQGDYVSVGQPLFAVSNLSTVWVELNAYENQLGQISKGDLASIRLPARPDAELSGTVEFVDPLLDTQTRTARVRLTVKNPDNLLKPGMFVNATIMADDNDTGFPEVPHTAVLWTGNRSVVYVKVPGDQGFTFEYREIETGARLQDTYQVTHGLSAGEEIAVNGVFALDAAAQLRGHYSMMAPPEVIAIPEPFRSDLEGLFNIYFDIKNALANDNHQEAASHARQLPGQLENVGEHSLTGDHHTFWMGQYAAISESIKDFIAVTDIEQQRVQFEPLSEAFIETARTLGAIGQTWYVAFCPMVDGDRGAYWLSEFEEILNPYFGSMMLRCGEVRETLREGVGNEGARPQPAEGHVH